MLDPTREDMIEAVGQSDEAEIAMYWFATLYHCGQGSSLYEALCASPYNPGPMRNCERDCAEYPEIDEHMETLQETFACPRSVH